LFLIVSARIDCRVTAVRMDRSTHLTKRYSGRATAVAASEAGLGNVHDVKQHFIATDVGAIEYVDAISSDCFKLYFPALWKARP
jgi:hypothetical protein